MGGKWFISSRKMGHLFRENGSFLPGKFVITSRQMGYHFPEIGNSFPETGHFFPENGSFDLEKMLRIALNKEIN